MAFKQKLKNFIGEPESSVEDGMIDNNEYYKDAVKQAGDSSGKMILLEPRAFSEAQNIVDYLKSRNTVVVNLKRVTPEIAKRVVDFLSGSVYAIGGDLQKLGGGIFLCTPNNIDVEGKMTDGEKAKKEKETESQFDW